MQAIDQFVKKTFVNSDGSFRAAFHMFDGPAEFEEKLESHLRKWLEGHLGGSGPTVAGPGPGLRPTWFGAPFRGLEVFDTEHQPIFFGRTAEASAVLGQLRRQAAAGGHGEAL